MSQFSIYEVWVVADRARGMQLSLVADEVFTARAEADAEMVRAEQAFLRLPFSAGQQSGYEVMTLDSYLALQRQDAENELILAGRRREDRR